MGDFGETEKPFLLNIDPFSYYILLEDFTNHFYNIIYDFYFVLKYQHIMDQKSYGSLNFQNLFEVMAVNSNSQSSSFEDSTSDSEQFRKKFKRYLADKHVEIIDACLVWYPICRKKPETDGCFRSDFFDLLKIFLLNHRDLILSGDTDDLLLNQVVVNFDIEVLWARIQRLEFSETFYQVTFNNLAKSDKGWNFNTDPSFFAWSDPPSYMWSYYVNKFHLEICPFIQRTLDKFSFMKPYFKWTQVYFFRIFEFIINDSTLQVITKLVIIPNCLAKEGKLYSDSEMRTFHAPLAEEVVERLLGFYDYFDDLCFFFPKSFYDPDKVSEELGGPGLSLPKVGNIFLRMFPSELVLKTPVESLAFHGLFDSDWDKHLPKVVNHKNEEDVSLSSESEYERDQVPDDQAFDEPNHDPCEDCEEFEFDKTGARVDKSYKDPYKKFAEGVDVCVSDNCVCSPPSSSSSLSFPSSSSFSFSSIPPNPCCFTF
jgi:hypothetical protein